MKANMVSITIGATTREIPLETMVPGPGVLSTHPNDPAKHAQHKLFDNFLEALSAEWKRIEKDFERVMSALDMEEVD